MTRIPVDTLAHEVRATLREHHPRLNGDNLIIVLARVSAFEHRALALSEKEPKPLSPAEFRSRTATIEVPGRDGVEATEDEIDALETRLDAAERPAVVRAPTSVVAHTGEIEPRTGKHGKKRRFRGVWEKLRAYLSQNPDADPKTAYEAIKRQYGGEFLKFTNFKQNYWNKLQSNS